MLNKNYKNMGGLNSFIYSLCTYVLFVCGCITRTKTWRNNSGKGGGVWRRMLSVCIANIALLFTKDWLM